MVFIFLPVQITFRTGHYWKYCLQVVVTSTIGFLSTERLEKMDPFILWHAKCRNNSIIKKQNLLRKKTEMTLEKEKVLYKTTIVSFSDVWRGRNATRSILHVIKNLEINKLTKTYPSLRGLRAILSFAIQLF